MSTVYLANIVLSPFNEVNASSNRMFIYDRFLIQMKYPIVISEFQCRPEPLQASSLEAGLLRFEGGGCDLNTQV